MTQVFISYSRKDISFIDRLAADLKNAGIDVWYDVSRIAGGARWRTEIENALRNCQYVIVVLSPDSIVSEWVEREFLFSSNLRRKIIPLMYRACEVPLNYVDLNYIDVQGENYARNFNELLKALNVGSTASLPTPSKPAVPSYILKPRFLALMGGGVLLTGLFLGSLLLKGLFTPTPAPTEPLERIIVTPDLSTPTLPPTPASATPAPAQITDSRGVRMALVPAGRFILGSNIGNVNERPVHEVEMDAFYIDLYEVTNSAYKACVDLGECTPPGVNALGGFLTSYYDDPQYAEYPVVYVNWFQARSYCEWRGAGLPTEAQWEKAARGTDGFTYPWGPYITCERANYSGCLNLTSAVGSFPLGVSSYGVHDLAGNVWEWVADWYSEEYYRISPFPANPRGPAEGQLRGLRGGSFVDDENSQRSFYRHREWPENFNWNIGFRCARGTDR